MSTAPVVIANFVTVTFVYRVTKITRRIALATCALSTQRPVKILFIHQNYPGGGVANATASIRAAS